MFTIIPSASWVVVFAVPKHAGPEAKGSNPTSDLPCSGPVTHSGEILTTGNFHGKKPDRISLNDNMDKLFFGVLLIHKICFTISLFHASTCFEHMCSSSGGQNCIIQPLVSSHSVGGRPVQMLYNTILTS